MSSRHLGLAQRDAEVRKGKEDLNTSQPVRSLPFAYRRVPLRETFNDAPMHALQTVGTATGNMLARLPRFHSSTPLIRPAG